MAWALPISVGEKVTKAGWPCSRARIAPFRRGIVGVVVTEFIVFFRYATLTPALSQREREFYLGSSTGQRTAAKRPVARPVAARVSATGSPARSATAPQMALPIAWPPWKVRM